jgi:hypothetical protein
MIERIQGWLQQVVPWLGAVPPTWYLVVGLSLLAALLLAAFAVARRARLRSMAHARAARAVMASSPIITTATVPAPTAREPQALEVSPVQSVVQPVHSERVAEPTPGIVAATGAVAPKVAAEVAALTPKPVGGVAVAERPPSALSGSDAAEGAYRQASALLAKSGGDVQTLRSAVALLRRAQEVWTREAAPERWAALQNEIGGAYQEMPSGDRAANLSAAIAHHESALEIFDPVRHAMSWAWTQSALAAAYQSLPTGSTISNARAAVAYHQRALDVLTPENAPLGWAWNQNNLGAAYELMRGVADGDRVRALRDAHGCYAEALRVYTPARYPVQHQIVTQNLLRVQDELRAIE